MKKKLAAIALVIVMVAMLFTGLTIAYFTDTDSATNTFTVGDIEIDVIEKGEHGDESSGNDAGLSYDKVVPGVEYIKMVTVKNTGSNPAYVRVVITMPDYMEPVWADYINRNWSRSSNKNEDGTVTYTVTYKEILAKDRTTDPCLVAVKLSNSVTQDQVNPENPLNVIVTAQAIQSEGFRRAEDAFAALNAELAKAMAD